MFRLPSGLYFSACLDSLFLSILCTCCSHFFGTVLFPLLCFVLPIFSLIHWFFSLSNFVIPSKCLKNFICAASKRCSSLFFSTQAPLPNFNAALAVMLWNLSFVSLFIISEFNNNNNNNNNKSIDNATFHWRVFDSEDNDDDNNKGKVIPLSAWIGREGSRGFEAPIFQDSRHMKVVRLSALRTGRCNPPGNIPGTHFC